MKKWREILALSCALLIIVCLFVFSQYMVKTETIDLSGTGVEYSIADSQYQRECDIIFQGEYTQSKLIGARFEGDLYIDGIAGLEIDNSVTISFSEPDTFGTPLFRNKIGAYQGTQICHGHLQGPCQEDRGDPL